MKRRAFLGALLGLPFAAKALAADTPKVFSYWTKKRGQWTQVSMPIFSRKTTAWTYDASGIYREVR